MLLKVPFVTESLSAKIAKHLLQWWQTTGLSLVPLSVTAMVKDVIISKEAMNKKQKDN